MRRVSCACVSLADQTILVAEAGVQYTKRFREFCGVRSFGIVFTHCAVYNGLYPIYGIAKINAFFALRFSVCVCVYWISGFLFRPQNENDEVCLLCYR